MRRWWETFFPSPRCLLCDSPHRAAAWAEVWERICFSCESRLSRIREPVCARCGRPLELEDRGPCPGCWGAGYALQGNRSALAYTPYTRELIHLFKYRGKESLAGPLAELMAHSLAELSWRVDRITYVPLHLERLRERGFNQAELLARGVAKHLHLPLAHVLERTVPTAPQSRSGRRERLKAMEGAFHLLSPVPEGSLSGRVFLLVDDVYTTGATLSECASVLKKEGAKAVYSVTLAR
ncbi:ComF family protein [Salinithrix halophila]|uniref:ComF family protein n=1 Tax=Salinithrix halophila TaxID=1485204 RepID=A0ABV8JEP3_9BACL